jgi:hypothetical protein
MSRRVVVSCVGVIALVAGLGAGVAGQGMNCQALMNQVGEQAKVVVKAENSVAVAQKALEDCKAAAQAAKKDPKKACQAQADSWQKLQAKLAAAKTRLEALQKDYNAKCGKK